MQPKRTMRPSVVRECERCHQPFKVHQSGIDKGRGKYCSRACHSASQVGVGLRRSTVVCGSCGRDFVTHDCRIAQGRGKYCSNFCARVASRTREVVACGYCGRFVLPPNRGYCSADCYHAAQRLVRKAVRVTVACETCGRSFEARPCEVVKGQGRFCSHACYGAFRSSHSELHGKGRHKGGKRADLGGLYVRSRWEANWARYLNFLQSQGQIISWAYEPETFEFPIKRGTRFYTPDFKVILPDGSVEYHEVKGYMTPESKTRAKRMAKYYPRIKIVMVERERYQGVARTMRALIPEWEWDAKKSN